MLHMMFTYAPAQTQIQGVFSNCGILLVACSLHHQDPWHPEHYGSYTPECLGLLFSVVKGNQTCNLSTPLVCPQVALFGTSFWILMFSLDRFGVCAVDISQ